MQGRKAETGLGLTLFWRQPGNTGWTADMCFKGGGENSAAFRFNSIDFIEFFLTLFRCGTGCPRVSHRLTIRRKYPLCASQFLDNRKLCP
jgi:hypothetical protein